eukprot:scaffold6356_cov118-Isochrysis_galbana.AAC.5
MKDVCEFSGVRICPHRKSVTDYIDRDERCSGSGALIFFFLRLALAPGDWPGASASIETLLTSGDSAGHPVPDDPSVLTPLPHYLPIPFPYSGRFSGGMVQKLRALLQLQTTCCIRGAAKYRPITVLLSPTCRAMGDPAQYPEIRAARFQYAMQWLPPDLRADYQLRQQWIDKKKTCKT